MQINIKINTKAKLSHELEQEIRFVLRDAMLPENIGNGYFGDTIETSLTKMVWWIDE